MSIVAKAHRDKKTLETITRHDVAEDSDPDRTPIVPREDFVHANVLVAEDNSVNQEVAQEIFTSLGCTVDIVADGEAAVKAFDSGTYDVIFLDCQMPGMDGYAAAKEIRKREAKGKRIPIIAMTAHVVKGARERCIKAGMDDYLAKPVSPDVVMVTLMRWTKPEPSPEGSVSDFESHGSVEKGETPVLDTARALELTGGRTKILERITKVFLKNVPPELEDLKKALDDEAIKEANRLSHSMKSAAAAMGGTRMTEAAAYVEAATEEGRLDDAREGFVKMKKELKRLSKALKETDWDDLAE